MKHYAIVFGGLAFRSLLQVALTIVVARSLGRSDYGATVAVAGIAAFFSVWVGLGASAIHLRDSATRTQPWQWSFAHHYSRMIRTRWPLIALALLVSWAVTRGAIGGYILVPLVTGEMLGAPLADLMTRSYQGRSRYLAMAVVTCALPFSRLTMAAGVLLVCPENFNLTAWGGIVFSSGAGLAGAAWWVAHRARNEAGRSERYVADGHVSGAAFAVAAASGRIHADVDKVVLARMSSMGTAADYSLAYRIVDVLLLPVSSMIEWSARSMFLHGQSGARAVARQLFRRWVAVGALAVIASLATFFLAPFLTWIVGGQYGGAETIAKWLCLLPMTTASWLGMRSLAAASGRERLVAFVESAGALLNAALCLALVQSWDWRGAVFATYLTHIGMVLATWGRLQANRGTSPSRG